MTNIVLFDEYSEGWTAPIEYDLRHKNPITGQTISFDATGMTVDIVLRDKTGSIVSSTGSVDWVDATISRVRYTPGAEDFDTRRSPMTLHFVVIDQLGGEATYPQGSPIKLKIFPR